MDEVMVVMTTVADEAAAQKLTRALLERRCAACVSRLAMAHSDYWWEGKIEQAQEWLLIIKTTAAQLEAIESLFQDLHPYTVPELLAVPTAPLNGPLSGAYRQWLLREVQAR